LQSDQITEIKVYPIAQGGFESKAPHHFKKPRSSKMLRGFLFLRIAHIPPCPKDLRDYTTHPSLRGGPKGRRGNPITQLAYLFISISAFS